MKISLSRMEIEDLANQRDANVTLAEQRFEKRLISMMPIAAKRGFITLDELKSVAQWKWKGGRTKQLCDQNSKIEVEEISGISFSAESERLRIGALTVLRGVGWPMASVILHFSFPERYPILDVRAMRTVQGSVHYNFERWMEYVDLCKQAAKREEVSLRTLDKALWQFDKRSGNL